MWTTTILASLVLIVTVVLTLKSMGKTAPLAPVIVLYGLGMVGVLIVGGLVSRYNQQRVFDQCVIAVKGREGVRDHFEFLYRSVAGSGTPSEQRTTFLVQAQADLDKNLPARALSECGDNPGL